MAVIRTWRELKVWQKSHELVLLTYKLTAQFAPEERYGLSSQMRRAAVSVASNIVEGFRRRTVKDSVHFYNTASSSLEELRYRFLLSWDLHYIKAGDYRPVELLMDEVGKMLWAWSVSQERNKSNVITT